MDSPPVYELFHEIADIGSAKVRRYVTDYSLEDRIQFRNLTYPEVLEALRARGSGAPPALWTGQRMIWGTEAVLAELSRLTNIGRED